MKQKIIAIIAFFSMGCWVKNLHGQKGFNLNSEYGENLNYNNLRIIIVTDRYESGQIKLMQYLRNNASYKIITEKYTANASKIKVQSDSEGYILFNDFITSTGAVQYKNFTSADNNKKINEFEKEIEKIKISISEINRKIINFDTGGRSFFYLKEELLNRQNSLAYFENALAEKKRESQTYILSIDYNNNYIEPGSEDESEIAKIRRWVNMPGVEFTRLHIEKPGDGISVPNYQGMQIKYIFTKGKDYLQLGAWKNVNKTTDSNVFKEMFLISAGQDFYSKRWGRGSSKFLNLYSGYNGGLLLLSSEKKRLVILPQISPCIGMDLFKTKHVLFDARVAYFLPLSLKYYQNLRGWAFSGSFNFVF